MSADVTHKSVTTGTGHDHADYLRFAALYPGQTLGEPSQTSMSYRSIVTRLHMLTPLIPFWSEAKRADRRSDPAPIYTRKVQKRLGSCLRRLWLFTKAFLSCPGRKKARQARRIPANRPKPPLPAVRGPCRGRTAILKSP
jgi:hypothetical protein